MRCVGVYRHTAASCLPSSQSRRPAYLLLGTPFLRQTPPSFFFNPICEPSQPVKPLQPVIMPPLAQLSVSILWVSPVILAYCPAVAPSEVMTLPVGNAKSRILRALSRMSDILRLLPRAALSRIPVNGQGLSRGQVGD